MCPPHPSARSDWACVLEVFDFNVHPKKLPKPDNTTQTAVLSHTSGQGVSEGTKADARRGQTDDPNPDTSDIPPSSPSSTLHGSRPKIAHEVTYTVHTEPSKISASGVFVNDVISKLPYTHAVRKDLCAVYSGFMIDDERIVGLKVGVVLVHPGVRFVERTLVVFIGFT